MWRGIAIAQAVIVIGAAVTAGVYTETGLLPLFSRFGQDTGSAVFYGLNMRGDYFFTFEDANGNAGRWERHTQPRFGGTPGEVYVNGMRFTFDADSITDRRDFTQNGLQVYGLQNSVRVWVTGDESFRFRLNFRDSLFARSGDVQIWADADCEGDSAVTLIGIQPVQDFAQYRMYMEEFEDGAWHREHFDYFDTDTANQYIMPPGQYRVWAAAVDTLGMVGHWVGPVEIMHGEPCQ